MVELTNWINQNLIVNDKANLNSKAPMTPIGVFHLGLSDCLSRIYSL